MFKASCFEGQKLLKMQKTKEAFLAPNSDKECISFQNFMEERRFDKLEKETEKN